MNVNLRTYKLIGMSYDVKSKGVSFPGQLGVLTGMTVGGIVIGTILSLVIWFLMTGSSIPGSPAEILQPKFYNVNMVLQAVSTFFIFFLPVYFFALICYTSPLKYLGFTNNFSQKQVLIVVLILIATFPLSGGLAAFNKWIPIPIRWSTYFTKMETEREAQEAALIQITSASKYIISLIGIALLPAIFEETFFRGGLQKLFTNWFKGPFVAIIVTSIIFSSIHISYYGFLVRFALGVILGLVYYFSGSIWLNILMHFLFNGIQVTLLYIYNSKPAASKVDIETGFPIWLAIIAFFALVYLMKQFIKNSDNPENKVQAQPVLTEFDQWTQNTLN